MSSAKDLLGSVANLWQGQFKVAAKAKQEKFGDAAARCWQFLGDDFDNLYTPRENEVEGEQFPQEKETAPKIRRNLTFDFVATFLPFIFHQIPDRRVNPSRQQPPPELLGLPIGVPLPPHPLAIQDRLRAWLMQWWLNYTPREYDYRGECRRALVESLVKGRGIVWIEMIRGTNGFIPAAKYGSVDHLLIDPDSERINEAGWIDRIKDVSIWRVAEEFKLRRDVLRAHHSSHQNQAMLDAEMPSSEDVEDEENPRGDVMRLHYVWTRGLGLGQKLLGTDTILKDVDKGLERISRVIESLNHNCWMVFSAGVPYPLNLPPEVLETATDAEIRDRLEWPIPFYHEHSNPWPFVPCDYYPNTDNCWAQSPIKAALPLQEFIDRVYSFMMTRVTQTSRTLYVADAALEEAFKNLFQFGVDQQMAFVKGRTVEDINKMFAAMDFGQLKEELWRLVQLAEIAFEKSTGMTSLIQGAQGATAIRSASEAKIRQGHAMNRPEDMGECAEDWQSQVARMEGFATRVMVPKETVAPLFGEEPRQGIAGPTMGMYSNLWEQLVNAAPEDAAKELSVTIEAGTSKRKNKQAQIATAEMLMQALGQPLLQYAQMNPMPWNALVRFLGEAYDTRLDDMMLAPPQQQQMMPPPQQQQPQRQSQQVM
jgi:hypothetical protein